MSAAPEFRYASLRALFRRTLRVLESERGVQGWRKQYDIIYAPASSAPEAR